MLGKMSYLIVSVLLQTSSLAGQIVDKGGVVEVNLENGLFVTVMPGFELQGQHTYYYLPTNIQLARRSDMTPEFSFLTYEQDSVVEGGILHFLVDWGLSSAQVSELERKLRTHIDSSAVVAGAIPLEIPADRASVYVSGNHKIAQILGSKWSVQPVAAILPGTKMAFAYKLDAQDALLIEESLATSKGLDSIHLNLLFQFKGGYHKWWLNRFGENYYGLSTSLKVIFAPVMTGKRK
jgi:hypothetical protein